MHIDYLTLFPSTLENYFSESLLGSAQDKGVFSLAFHDFRSSSTNKHRSVDDAPFGGGAGMVLAPQPLFDYVESNPVQRPIIYLSPTGAPFTQAKAKELASLNGFTLLSGRYEGVDQRIRDELVDEEISIGDFVLAGGEPAAIVVSEAVLRLVPGVLGNSESIVSESFSNGLLEHPQYTRPADFRGMQVPEELLSGDHALIERWRHAHSLYVTYVNRPDLIKARGGFSEADKLLLDQFDLRV